MRLSTQTYASIRAVHVPPNPSSFLSACMPASSSSAASMRRGATPRAIPTIPQTAPRMATQRRQLRGIHSTVGS